MHARKRYKLTNFYCKLASSSFSVFHFFSTGVILTLPEYRLSFQLKIYESIYLQVKQHENRNFESAKNVLDMFNWTNANVRTILDESDAILHVKYQLIYPIGEQMKPDGDSQRWTVVQALLKRVPIHMRDLYNEFGKEKVEYGHSHGSSSSMDRNDVFTPCRILDPMVFEALKDKLIDDFLENRLDLDIRINIDDKLKQDLEYLLKNKALTSEAFRAVERFSTVEQNQNIIYILSGLLRFEVLHLALTKRWRINYGVDVNSKRKMPSKMAIPFKAKDVAAEMSEFGHTDVAVCFTQLSYYYSGDTYCVVVGNIVMLL